MIPKYVTHSQFTQAMEPLWELLGVDPGNVYITGPGIVISSGVDQDVACRISFNHVPPGALEAGTTSVLRGDGTSVEVPASNGMRSQGLQEGDEHEELAQMVTVDVLYGELADEESPEA